MITVNNQAGNMRDILGETDLKSENRKNTTFPVRIRAFPHENNNNPTRIPDDSPVLENVRNPH